MNDPQETYAELKIRLIREELSKLKLHSTFYGMSIPDYMHEGLARFVATGQLPGNFLQAVLCNNLKESVAQADDKNMFVLPAYANWMYNHAPSEAQGSHEKMMVWRSIGGLAGKEPDNG